MAVSEAVTRADCCSDARHFGPIAKQRGPLLAPHAFVALSGRPGAALDDPALLRRG